MSIIIIFTAFILLFLFYNYYWKRRDFPSGPPPLPLVGNIASMMSKKRAEYQFVEWKEKYGKINFKIITGYNKFIKTLTLNLCNFNAKFMRTPHFSPQIFSLIVYLIN